MEAPAALLLFIPVNHIHNKNALSSGAYRLHVAQKQSQGRPIIACSAFGKKRYDFYVLYLNHVYHMSDYIFVIPLTQGRKL